MKKAKIAIVSLGHYIYFNQFEGLREELMAKSEDFSRSIFTQMYATFSMPDTLTVLTLLLPFLLPTEWILLLNLTIGLLCFVMKRTALIFAAKTQAELYIRLLQHVQEFILHFCGL